MITQVQAGNANVSLEPEKIPEHVGSIAKLFNIAMEGKLAEIEKQCIKALVTSFKTNKLAIISSCNLSYLSKLKDLSGKTLLMHATKRGFEDLVSYCIKNQIALHERDNEGNTSLHYAVKRNALQSIPVLLRGGMNIKDANKAGETPLHVGIKEGKHEAVKCLLDLSKNIITPLIENGILWSPAALSIRYGHKKCADLLLDKDSLFEETGTIGTLLHVAIQYGQPKMVEYLLYSKKVIECLSATETSLKTLIEKKNAEKLTPLNLAAKLGDLISIRLLFEKEASLETKDAFRNRPLHHAVKAKQFEAVQLLVMLGAKIKALNHEDETPIEISKKDTTSIGLSITNFLSSALVLKKDFKIEIHQLLPENYVFKGGGPKGIAYAGVVRYMQEKGLLAAAKRIAGTSAGSFPAGFLGCGAGAAYIEDLQTNTDMLKYLDPPCSKDSLLKAFNYESDGISSKIKLVWNLLRSIRSTKDIVLHPLETLKKLRTLTGICEGEEFRLWDEAEIKKLTGIDFFTLGDLRRHIETEGNTKNFKHISIFGTRLQNEKGKSCSVKFSSEDQKNDNYILSDLMRISMSIPGVFKPHIIHVRENGKRIPRPDLGQFVDGGLLNNLPMETYDYKGYQSREELGEKGAFPVFNKRTIGFDLCSSLEEVEDIDKVETLFGLIKHLVGTYMEAEENIRLLNPYASSRIIKINVGKVGLLSFDLNSEQKKVLDQAGYDAAKEYFEKTILEATGNSSSSTLLKAYKGHIAIPTLLPEKPFNGKKELLEQLKNFFAPKEWTSKRETPLALLNESQIDKKEAALAFAHQNVEEFSIIKLIDCGSTESLLQGYHELADILHVFWKNDTFAEDINRELETASFTEKEVEKPWLLIFDNVNPEVVKTLPLPKNGGGILAISAKPACIWAEEEVVFEIPSLEKNNFQNQSPLHRAAANGRLKNVNYLIEQGCDKNAVDSSNRTPLFLAVEGGHTKTAKLLFEKSADITILHKDTSDSILHVLASQGNAECLEYFLSKPDSKKIINQGDYEGKTPLHKAVFKGKPRHASVTLLCNNGADVLAKTQYGHIPLHWSCMYGHLDSTKLFIQKKAPMDLLNVNDDSPFDLAMKEKQYDTIHYLLKTKKRLPKGAKNDNQTIEEFYLQQIASAHKENMVEEEILYFVSLSRLYKETNNLNASHKALSDAIALEKQYLKNSCLERYLAKELQKTPIANEKKKEPSIKADPGLSIQFSCSDITCLTYKKVVWISKGMGQFNIGEEFYMHNECQSCKKESMVVENLGFFDCIYNVNGQQKKPIKQKVEKTNITVENTKLILLAEEGKFGHWPSLNIETKPRK